MNKQPQNAVGLGPDYMIPELIEEKERDDAPVAIVLPKFGYRPLIQLVDKPLEVVCDLCPRVTVSVTPTRAYVFADIGINDGDWYQQKTLEQCADAVLPLLAAKLEEALVVLREMIRVNERKES